MTATVLGPVSGIEGWVDQSEVPAGSKPARGRYVDGESNASPGAFERMVHAMGHEIDSGESRVNAALSGAATHNYSSVDLIVLQAGIYRYTEAVELAARLVDRAGQAIRTTLQSSGG